GVLRHAQAEGGRANHNSHLHAGQDTIWLIPQRIREVGKCTAPLNAPCLSRPLSRSSTRKGALTIVYRGGRVVGARGVSLGMVKTKQRPGAFRCRAFYFTAALVARHAQWPLCIPRVSITVAKAR